MTTAAASKRGGLCFWTTRHASSPFLQMVLYWLPEMNMVSRWCPSDQMLPEHVGDQSLAIPWTALSLPMMAVRCSPPLMLGRQAAQPFLPCTVPLTVPFTAEGLPVMQAVDDAWSSRILFPERARTARHAVMLSDAHSSHVNELFAFDAIHGSWGIYDLVGASFLDGETILPSEQRGTKSECVEDAMPTVSPNRKHVAIALRTQSAISLRLYRLPESCTADEACRASSTEHGPPLSPRQPYLDIPILQDDSLAHQEISFLRWLKVPNASRVQRLVIVGNVTTSNSSSGTVPALSQGSTGIVIVMDFDGAELQATHSPVPIQMPMRTTYDLDTLSPGERLPEGEIDFETEVELVRTRTVARQRAAHRATESSRHSPTSSEPNATVGRGGPADRSRGDVPLHLRDDETMEEDEAQVAFEAPYDHSQPRSQASLQRAATVSAVSPASRRHLRALPLQPLEYRRADGLREAPHESDADNWVPPPPPYSENDDQGTISLSHPVASPSQIAVPSDPFLAMAAPSSSSTSTNTSGAVSQTQSTCDLVATGAGRTAPVRSSAHRPRPHLAPTSPTFAQTGTFAQRPALRPCDSQRTSAFASQPCRSRSQFIVSPGPEPSSHSRNPRRRQVRSLQPVHTRPPSLDPRRSRERRRGSVPHPIGGATFSIPRRPVASPTTGDSCRDTTSLHGPAGSLEPNILGSSVPEHTSGPFFAPRHRFKHRGSEQGDMNGGQLRSRSRLKFRTAYTDNECGDVEKKPTKCIVM